MTMCAFAAVPATRYSFGRMDWTGEWWVVILGAGAIFLVVGALYLTRSRAFRLRSAAAQLGFISLQGLNPFSDEEKKALNLFSRGDDGEMVNLFGDRFDSPSMLLFDFVYSFGVPPNPSVRYSQTAAAFKVHGDGVPDFQMIPATALDATTPKVSPPAIRFDSHPDFAKRYCLRGEDETAVHAFFGSALLDRLTASDAAADWSVEKSGSWLIVYRHDGLFAPKAIPESWQHAQEVANLFLESR
jgi:hypothetical protein